MVRIGRSGARAAQVADLRGGFDSRTRKKVGVSLNRAIRPPTGGRGQLLRHARTCPEESVEVACIDIEVLVGIFLVLYAPTGVPDP